MVRGGGLLAGIAARTEPTMRNWLGELPQVHPITRALSGTPPRTGQIAGASAPIQLGVNGQRKALSVRKNANEVHNC